MDIIARGRKTSRTTELIERAAIAEAEGKICYIVCHSMEEAQRIFQKANEMGKKIGFPITYREFLGRDHSGRNIDHLLIDNADILLQSLTSVRINAIVVEKTDE